MSPRRLFTLIRYLPADDVFWRAKEADEKDAEEKALQARLRARRNHYRSQGGAA